MIIAEYWYSIIVKRDTADGKSSAKTRYSQRGTDIGNACKRFLCQHDMKDREIVSVRSYSGRRDFK